MTMWCGSPRWWTGSHWREVKTPWCCSQPQTFLLILSTPFFSTRWKYQQLVLEQTIPWGKRAGVHWSIFKVHNGNSSMGLPNRATKWVVTYGWPIVWIFWVISLPGNNLPLGWGYTCGARIWQRSYLIVGCFHIVSLFCIRFINAGNDSAQPVVRICIL